MLTGTLSFATLYPAHASTHLLPWGTVTIGLLLEMFSDVYLYLPPYLGHLWFAKAEGTCLQALSTITFASQS